jgi:hypothetical protein
MPKFEIQVAGGRAIGKWTRTLHPQPPDFCSDNGESSRFDFLEIDATWF